MVSRLQHLTQFPYLQPIVLIFPIYKQKEVPKPLRIIQMHFPNQQNLVALTAHVSQQFGSFTLLTMQVPMVP